MFTSQMLADIGHEIIGELTIADAILYRLVNDANRLELCGDSLRKHKPKTSDKEPGFYHLTGPPQHRSPIWLLDRFREAVVAVSFTRKTVIHLNVISKLSDQDVFYNQLTGQGADGAHNVRRQDEYNLYAHEQHQHHDGSQTSSAYGIGNPHCL